MEKVYIVTVLNSGEAIMDSDCVVRVFDNFDDAAKAFQIEKESAKDFMVAGARLAVEDGEYEDIKDAYDSIVREDSEFSYVAYDNYRAFAVAVKLEEVANNNSVIGVSF